LFTGSAVQILIRTVTGRALGEALETEYQCDKLTLGSGGNNTLQLTGLAGRLSFKHAQGGSARFSATGLKASIGGKQTRKAVVSIGDQLQVPGYTIEVIAPPQGFDFALQLEAEGVSYVDGMELGERAWSMRRASWMGALLVLALCLIMPALVLLWPERAATLRESLLPDDSLWSSGPLIGAHATAGVAKDCQACHQTPFVMVQDSACLECHRDINEHVDIGVHTAEEFSEVRCASCHREHNEPARLVPGDNALCVDCHSEPARWKDEAGSMAAVTAFTAADHPQFRLDLLTPRGQGGALHWEVQQERQDREKTTGLKEQSNLKFSHMVHLDKDKVQQENTSEALSCASCHTLDADREHFKPITMDNQCRSCHKLNFDTFEPDLELPHADPRAAIVAMEAHFIREFSDPELAKDRATTSLRRVPGKRDAAASCAGGPAAGLECGLEEALKEAQFQFAEAGCVTCHEVTTHSDKQNIHDRWSVQPIKITSDWFKESRFDHASHLSKAAEDTADTCLGCHEAKKSEEATDILIPDEDNCLACHDQGNREMSVTCVSCHAFHQPSGTSSLISRGVDPDLPHPSSKGGQGE
jgi:predicted CXXCH cytochrome family protein